VGGPVDHGTLDAELRHQPSAVSRQQASKDINTYITEHAPKNLTCDRQIKGYVEGKQFKPLSIDDSSSA
jgi:hypothetical protein